MKELIRRFIFAFIWKDEFIAQGGTLKFRFFNWLYEGDAEPMLDVQMPDGERQPSTKQEGDG